MIPSLSTSGPTGAALTAAKRLTPARAIADTMARTDGPVTAIAREAGCSEAAFYKHYANKEELFVRVLMERTPNAGPLMTELARDHAERSVEEGLAAIAWHASLFYADAMPMAASLFAEPALLTRHREGVREIGTGPHVVRDALTGRLRRELERGRLRPDADPEAAAELLLGACFQRAFFLHFCGPEVVRPVEEFAPAVARTLWAAIR
ncbi:TetR/AcrR family transcriptional regulator [Streptomyces sp. NBC_01278]|uniref:TetR/AcrR family transcriptional regulator n=1 Tax=Streptomyces sp. NBC_01278 TaxID=2903809 RepID=UPI002E379CD8|nr:TetR/AcrR family transcriptional regulator [Streptomyces sp. NBC_01278]